MNNMEIYKKLARPPKDALKSIGGGRLKGMTDIKPQWRVKAMTEIFGPCGLGWTYSIDKVWSEAGGEGDLMCFAIVSVKYNFNGLWSELFQGIGGSQIIEKETKGLHTNDEGYKMAVTDALSVALKMIGVAADIYMGNWDGTKFRDDTPTITDSAYWVKQISEAKTVDELKGIFAEAWKATTDHDTIKGAYDSRKQSL